MAIKKKPITSTITIDLTGPQGNAFYLLGTANKLAKELGLDEKANMKIQLEMQSGDYDNLVNVFDKYFGDCVTLYK